MSAVGKQEKCMNIQSFMHNNNNKQKRQKKLFLLFTTKKQCDKIGVEIFMHTLSDVSLYRKNVARNKGGKQ